jgi:8-oxo-dGTP diphosphatase
MIGYLLFLIARLVVVLSSPLGVLYTLIRRFVLGQSKTLGKYYIDMAYLYDVFVNVCWGDFFNDVFGKWKVGYRYGNAQDSISRVLGKNKALQQLTRFETWVANWLNKLDRGHVEKASR